ncbi:hypothetical protein ACFV14_03195 [Streptomyces zaomyceticus]
MVEGHAAVVGVDRDAVVGTLTADMTGAVAGVAVEAVLDGAG